MTIDNTGGEHDGRIYVTWTDFDPQSIGERSGTRILFSYSTDHGDNFTRPVFQVSTVTPNPGPGASMPPFFFEEYPQAPYVQASVPVVAPNGDLYVVWLNSFDEPGGPGYIKIRKNTSGGNPDYWGDILTAANITVAWHNYIGKLHGSSFPTIAITPSGILYIAYTQWINDDDLDIYYVLSTDGGET